MLGNLTRESQLIIILLVLLASVVVAGLVIVYVAFPHRGEEMPRAAWLGRTLERGVDAMPTIRDREDNVMIGRR